jgi:signal transduction histidine kinase
MELHRGPVDLRAVILDAIDVVSPAARKKGVPITCDVEPGLAPVDGDVHRLKQVVWNLLANAVKFSQATSPVAVVAGRSPGGGIDLSVEDGGSGIDPAFLPFVFDRFRQEDSSPSRRSTGLGVGLAITRAIVLAHGGRIEVESAGRGCGCRVKVELPAERVGGASRPDRPD